MFDQLFTFNRQLESPFRTGSLYQPDLIFHPSMSFQGLISGSECTAPANPLSQVLKHTEADRSLQQVCASLSELGKALTLSQDRISGPSSPRVRI